MSFAGSVEIAVVFLERVADRDEVPLKVQSALRGDARWEPICSVGMRWRERASMHLQERLDRELRAGQVRPTTEQAAVEAIREVARALRAAAEDLMKAAERAKKRGDPMGANEAYEAHRRAWTHAESLLE